MFPGRLPWINVASLRMDQQRGRPVLIEFWDFCRVNSLRTLPYLQAWHERYAGRRPARHRRPHGRASRPRATRPTSRARRAPRDRAPGRRSTPTSRSGTSTATRAGPRATCGTRDRALHSMHYGEGAYAETEREIQALLGLEREPLAPVRPEDDPGRAAARPDRDQPGAYSGPYEAGGVWAVLDGAGRARQRPRDRGRPTRAPTRWSSTPPHPGRARARARRRRDLPGHLLHAGRSRLSSAWPRPSSRRRSRGGPSSPTSIAVPGQ